MKKKILIAISSVAVAAILGFGIYQSNAAQAEPELSQAEIEELVTAQYPGTIIEVDLDKGFNKAVYEVEVESNGKKYEIELDGNTGEILKLEEKEIKVAANNGTGSNIKEKINENTDDNNQSDNEQNKQEVNNDNASKEKDTSKQAKKDNIKQNKNNKKVVIDAEAAKKIALNEYAGTIKELELDEDDGRLIYEIEIKGTNGEAELEVDAYTGEIIYISINSEIGAPKKNNSAPAPSGKSGDSDDLDDDDDDDEEWDDDDDDDDDD